MHDDSHHTVRTIDWRTVFPFTRLFNAFRIAIHPAKLALALAAILLVYTAGRVIDGLWAERHSAVVNEVTLYERTGSRVGFRDAVDAQRQRFDDARAGIVAGLRADAVAGRLDKPVPEKPSYRETTNLLQNRRDREVKAAHDAYGSSAKDDAAKRVRDASIAGSYQRAADEHHVLDASRGRGVFATFMDYETTQVDGIAQGVINFNWTGPGGVFPSLRAVIFTGPGWALAKHPLHAVLMTLVMLFAWSVFGGAIARIAAVHVARDEKISVRQALRFSSNKLMSFFAAPIMPMLIVGAIALVLALVGLLTEIPFVGGLLSVVLGAGFIVAIFVGVLLACSLIGTVAGFNLMYPTIAVEGSDAFDAVSRSFSYVFARPWKVLFYALLSLTYAAVTYVALRLIVYLTLAGLHGALNAWTRPPVGTEGTTSFAHAWPAPAGPFELTGPIDFFSLTFAEKLTAFFLSFWLYLFVSLLAAYLLSFFISSGTITYYLLRRDVDATPTDDVYLDPEDAEEGDEFDDVAGNPVPPPANMPPTPPVPATVAALPDAAPAPQTHETPHPVIPTDGPEPSQNPT